LSSPLAAMGSKDSCQRQQTAQYCVWGLEFDLSDLINLSISSCCGVIRESDVPRDAVLFLPDCCPELLRTEHGIQDLSSYFPEWLSGPIKQSLQ
jgi:hypothetical protein